MKIKMLWPDFRIFLKKWQSPLFMVIAAIFSTNLVYGQKAILNIDTSIKSHNLLHPIPKNEMKEMETDRPDVTESAYTVEPGHFQVETDLYKYARSKDGSDRNSTHIFNLGNYKFGLNKRTDVQFVIPTYSSHAVRDHNTGKITGKTSGFDDITLRFKYNIWGYSGGKTAFAALPFISFPTSSFSHNGIQGGIVFPFAVKINGELDFGTQAEVDIIKQNDNNYHPDLSYSFTFGKSVSPKVSAFGETVTAYSTYFKTLDFYINGGIIYSFSENCNVDAGFNYGVTKRSDKIFFTGLSFRL